jgi:transposase
VLRGTRYIWLRNPDTLSERQRTTLESLPTRHLKTARAYQPALFIPRAFISRSAAFDG